jgi:hypothetical protein
MIFEPSLDETPTVKSVENIVDAGKVITDLILAQDQADASYKNAETSFTGRFAIIRTIKSDAGNELSGEASRKGFAEAHL